jgi:hypothetical protein
LEGTPVSLGKRIALGIAVGVALAAIQFYAARFTYGEGYERGLDAGAAAGCEPVERELEEWANWCIEQIQTCEATLDLADALDRLEQHREDRL